MSTNILQGEFFLAQGKLNRNEYAISFKRLFRQKIGMYWKYLFSDYFYSTQEIRTRERKGAQIFASVKRHKKDCANLNKNLT